MGKPGRVENLIPQNRRTKEEQRAIASQGGKASAKARREKKLMSHIYAEFLAEKFEIIIDDKVVSLTGEKLVNSVVKQILVAGGAPAVSLLKEIREGIEGQKVNIESLSFAFPEEMRNELDQVPGRNNPDAEATESPQPTHKS